MFRITCLITLVLLVCSCIAFSQDAPRAEVFGGYQYLRASTGVSGVDSLNLNGWNASFSGYFNHYLGVTGDFSGAYGTPTILGVGLKTTVYTYMFGPVVRLTNNSKFTPFAHALFGGGHFKGEVLGVSATDSGFTWAAGGGLDVNLNSKVAVRVAQADFVQTKFFSDSQNNFRYSAGIVFKF
ncbi:MAG: porin family protein [Acidobacteriia bacterium]|nr:porin family protein [Terriglobia bacterium]